MLKSEIKKLENLQPADVAKHFRNIYKTKKEFEENISKYNQNIIYNLVFNLLEDNHKADCGYFFQKLLDEKNISYYELANYIDGYVYCHEKSVDSKEYILSSLQKMLNLKNFTENNKLANYICKYFSIDLNLLKCGIGYKYKINFDKTENLINKILEPCLDESDKKEYENYKNFVLESDQAFSELLLNKNVKVFDEFCYDTNTELLKKEKVCLWDFDYLKIMIMKLSVKEQLAVFSLIEQLEK